jgi:UDP-N-acetylglucosamine 2-epimerase (non-hydrolysing)
MKILHVVGARPNFMKVAPVFHAMSRFPDLNQAILHSGQHYDVNMSDVFFQQLEMPAPAFNLDVGSGTHARQTAEIMIRIEPVLLAERPDWVMVYGDVNSTVAAALVCKKLLIKVAHVEAGLRSFDRTMPEEINRVVTDQLADILFTPSQDGNENLQREGIASERIHLVGNVMIDTLLRMLPSAPSVPPPLKRGQYVLVTLHRPSNVDDPAWLRLLFTALEEIAGRSVVVFPVHPRTRKHLAQIGLGVEGTGNVILLEPQPYLNFLALQRDAALVITDSGGVQEETTFLGVPCITVRENTERPVTVSEGTNTLVGRDIHRMRSIAADVLTGHGKKGCIPPLWDGKASERIARILAEEDQTL